MKYIPLYTKEHFGRLYIKYYDMEKKEYVEKSIRNYPASFFVERHDGEFISSNGMRVTEIKFDNIDEYNDSKRTHKAMGIGVYGDINIGIKYASEHYKLSDDVQELIDYPVEIPRVGWYDIETWVAGDIDTKNAPNNITTISMYDQQNDDWMLFGYKEDLNGTDWQDGLNDEDIDVDIDVRYIYCESEVDMMNKFAKVVRTLDVLVGFNSEMFDDAYIVNRMGGISTNKLLSPFGVKSNTYTKKGEWGSFEKASIIGMNLLDYKLLLQHYYKKMPMYNLEFVSNELLGVGKDKYTGNLNDLYENDFKAYCRYNVNDTRRMVQMDKKIKLLPLGYILSTIFYVNFETVQHMTSAYDAIIYKNLSTTVTDRSETGLIKNIGGLAKRMKSFPSSLRFHLKLTHKRYELTETNGGMTIDKVLEKINTVIGEKNE